jgi:hypothetical protein
MVRFHLSCVGLTVPPKGAWFFFIFTQMLNPPPFPRALSLCGLPVVIMETMATKFRTHLHKLNGRMNRTTLLLGTLIHESSTQKKQRK